MKRVPAVFTVAPPQHPDPRRQARARWAHAERAWAEWYRRMFLRRVEP